MIIGVTGNPRYEGLRTLLGRVAQASRTLGFTVQSEPDLDRLWPAPVPPLSLDASRPDVLLCFGGDGTLLRTVRLVGPRRVPILGIKIGRVGFLTTAAPESLDEALRQVTAGQYYVEPHRALSELVERTAAEFTVRPEVLMSRSRRRSVVAARRAMIEVLIIVVLQALQHRNQQLQPRKRAPGLQPQRSGFLRQHRRNELMIDVHSDADQHVRHAQRLGGHLHQNAGALFLVHHNVVRPAQVHSELGGFLDGFGKCHAREQRKHRRRCGCDRRTQQDREVAAGGPLGVPVPPETPAPGGLLLGDDQGSFLRALGG